MNVTRRGFLKGMGAVAGASGVSFNLPVIAHAAEKAEAAAAAKSALGDQVVKSTCVHCVNFCGIEARVSDGVIRAIYPDKARSDYYNWGICPKGASGVFNTYNPYRLKKPMKRTNPNKGMTEDPKWVEISWDEAFQTISSKLAKIKGENPAKFVWHHGHGKYTCGDQFPKAFCAAFGTPNVIHRTTTCESSRHVADELTWGYHGHLPDLEYTQLYLSFGSNPFEGEQWSRWLDHAIMEGKERGMKMIVIEPRLSHAAAKANEWIPIRPGKDAVFILALCKQLIDNNTIDAGFLTTYTNATQLVGEDGLILKSTDGKPLVWDGLYKSARNYDDGGIEPALAGSYEISGKTYRTAFQVLADSLKDVTPDYAAEVTGVPAARIKSLAQEIAAAASIGSVMKIDGQNIRYRPVVAYTFRGLSAKEFGVQNSRAALILNMLIGSPDAVGGLHLHDVMKNPAYLEASKCEYPPKRVDLAKSVYFPHGHHDVCQQVQYTVMDPKAYGLGYTPEMQIFFATNRPMSTSDALKQQDGMKKTFNVVIDIVNTETAQFADIVLPDLTYLESWHFSPTRWTPNRKHSAIRQPMTNAYNIPYDAQTILWELAKRLGIRDAYVDNLNKQWGLKEHTFQKGRDYTSREMVEVLWAEKAHKPFQYALDNGFTGKKVDTKARYLSGLETKMKGAGQPRMKLYVDQLVQSYNTVEKTVKANGIANIDLAGYKLAYSPIPLKEHAFPAPHREAKDYPLYLITHKRMYRNQAGNTAQNPILNALGADTQENFIAVNSDTAKGLGIKDGDTVVVESRVGKAKGKAKLTQGIRPDTIAVSYHHGHWSLGFPDAAKKGTWINQAMELHPDKISGMNSFNDTKVKLYKA
jgi:anaerobic selenocysteine-containing dehydrogenase